MSITPAAEVLYLFLLIDQNATSLEGRAAGLLGMKSAENSELVSFPLDFLKRDLDFGTFSSDGAEAVSTTSLESQQGTFSLTFDELRETSYVSSLFKVAKNAYVNHDLANNQWGRYVCGRSFSGSLAAAEGEYGSAESILSARKYGNRAIALDPSGYTVDEVISGQVNTQIVPPTLIAIPNSTDSFSAWDPLSSTAPRSSFVVAETQPAELPAGFTSGCSIGGSVRNPLDGALQQVKLDGLPLEMLTTAYAMAGFSFGYSPGQYQ